MGVTGHPDLPDGEYGFMELYCDEPNCDCRRVTMTVITPEYGWDKIYATISYGWETADFYRRWFPGGDPVEMQGPELNPLGPQSERAEALLDLFRMLIESPDYVERLKRHYAMFRESVDGGRGGSAPSQAHGQAHRLRTTSRRGRGS